MFGMSANDHDRAGGVSADLLGDAAQEPVQQSGVPAVADDDEVGVELLRGVDDLLGGMTEAHLRADLHAMVGRFGRDLVAEPTHLLVVDLDLLVDLADGGTVAGQVMLHGHRGDDGALFLGQYQRCLQGAAGAGRAVEGHQDARCGRRLTTGRSRALPPSVWRCGYHVDGRRSSRSPTGSASDGCGSGLAGRSRVAGRGAKKRCAIAVGTTAVSTTTQTRTENWARLMMLAV